MRSDPISLRFPPELRHKIDQAAKSGGRSLNAEIRMRLEWSFEAGFGGTPSNRTVEEEVAALKRQVSDLKFNLGNLYEACRENDIAVRDEYWRDLDD